MCKIFIKACLAAEHLLVAMMFQMLLVAVVLQHVLRVVFPEPLSFVDVKRTSLGLHLFAFSAPRYRGRQA